MKFTRTRRAAEAEKTTKWDLIAAIADDAVEHGLPITGMTSQLAAREALDSAGNEYAVSTITNLCVVAKFDHESTAKQRQVWRTYGWSIVQRFAHGGYSQEEAARFLTERRRSQREVEAFMRSMDIDVHKPDKPPVPLDDAWMAWLRNINRLLVEGAELAERSETEADQLGVYAALAMLTYQRIAERKIDAELRQLLESVETQT